MPTHSLGSPNVVVVIVTLGKDNSLDTIVGQSRHDQQASETSLSE